MFSFIKKLFKPSLFEASKKGDIEAVKQHLAAGTDVNAWDDLGWTPLIHAAEGGHKEVAELLIAAGADVNAKTKGSGMLVGDTPADTAIKYYSQSSQKEDAARKETADLLRQHGGKTAEELKAEGK